MTQWTGKRNKTKLEWTTKMNDAFDELRKRAAEDVELAYPNYEDQENLMELFTDASGFCMGGCLTRIQNYKGEKARRVIEYVSKAFNAAERRYSTIERELAGLRFAVKSFKPFLWG